VSRLGLLQSSPRPVQRPYSPNTRRVAELIQADRANVGVTAEIVSFELANI
jgi:dipeptide transport system substrate-binding protein